MNARAVVDRRLMTNRARSLRRESTEAEQRRWSALRNRRLEGTRFRRQVVLGRYVADFCSAHPKLVVELDGIQHEDQRTYDEARTRYLEAQGYLVLRFWNGDVFVHLDAVLGKIAEEIHKIGARQEQAIGESRRSTTVGRGRPPALTRPSRFMRAAIA